MGESTGLCVRIIKDSIVNSDFKGVDTYIDDENLNFGDVGYEDFKVNDADAATSDDTFGYNSIDYLHVEERKANLRVLINDSETYDLKSHTGGFVNDRPFFTDAKLCSVPWGKSLNVKIVDMSHGERKSADGQPVNHFHTLKECNDEGDSQVITSIENPITVELKVLLIDPNDQKY